MSAFPEHLSEKLCTNAINLNHGKLFIACSFLNPVTYSVSQVFQVIEDWKGQLPKANAFNVESNGAKKTKLKL